MDPFDEIVIKNYLSLSFIISRLEYRKKILRRDFYFQNMATHIEYRKVYNDQFEMVTKGFRPDNEVEELLLNLDSIDRRIQRYVFRKKHFSRFLATLTTQERNFLVSYPLTNCPEYLIKKTLDEINEIETALCFREGIEPEETDCTDDVDSNLERMYDFFAI
ncbi:hypothetical protein M2139_000311 [Enterococcus sp. PF1-24]|uniref:hypothetical protein n=1 Tax=unclassified Enterococcus TaxID=2608891 RepID=UPI002473038C|nr:MULTISPECIES: hypothetical protein [unclassified Enterococcus]MDH6363269.1 hypothetical protein [Enterococcus sp. PFB1-1]MDH6400430.1 hypothetical protein [Enterococcus sp. PF1-24]